MFENALSNFALWVDTFILALEGAHAIQNFDLNELIDNLKLEEFKGF